MLEPLILGKESFRRSLFGWTTFLAAGHQVGPFAAARGSVQEVWYNV